MTSYDKRGLVFRKHTRMKYRPKACPICQSHNVERYHPRMLTVRNLLPEAETIIDLHHAEGEYDDWICENCNHTWRFRHPSMRKRGKFRERVVDRPPHRSKGEPKVSFDLDTYQTLKLFEWYSSLIKIYEGAIGGALSFLCTIQEDGTKIIARYGRPPIYEALGLGSESIDLTELSCKKNITRISDIILKHGKSADLFIQRGIFKRLDGDRSAIDDFMEALRCDPSQSQAQLQLGITFHSLHQYEQAYEAYTRAIQHNPNCAITWLYRGILFLHKDDYDACQKDWEQAYALDKDIKNLLETPVTEYLLNDTYVLHFQTMRRHIYYYTYLDDDEYLKFANWMNDNNLSLNLSNGESFEFSFCNTGLGKITKVTYMPLGISIDLTDYDSW